MHLGKLFQIALPNMWLLVRIEQLELNYRIIEKNKWIKKGGKRNIRARDQGRAKFSNISFKYLLNVFLSCLDLVINNIYVYVLN